MKKVLSLFSNDGQEDLILEKEKVILGSDESCDFVLVGEEFSKKHAAVVNKYGSLYIENLSSHGTLLKNGNPIEYSELESGDEIKIGNYSLKLKLDESDLSEDAPSESEEASHEYDDGSEAESPLQEIENHEQEIEEVEEHLSLNGEEEENAGEIDFNAPLDVEHEENALIEHSPEKSDLVAQKQNDMAIFQEFDELSQEKTMLSNEKSVAILKITKGENIGREIKLQHGHEWIVGRGKSSDIVVENSKLSRQHFKVVKIGNGYRLQDLGSSNGSRLNGVSITDAPLQVYDTIKAGPVELQFIVVDKNIHGAVALPQPKTDSRKSAEKNPNANSDFQAPILYQEGDDNYQKIELNDEFTKNTAAPDFSESKKERKVVQIKNWWSKQPKKRKTLWYSAAAFIFLFSSLMMVPTKNQKREIANEDKVSKEKDSLVENAAIPSDVSSDFNLKTPEEKEEISKFYIEADQARRNRNWSRAYEFSSKILEKVDKYKDTNDIMSSALLFLNEQDISTFQKKGNELLTAKEENRGKVKDFLQSGEKALKDGRWKDAEIAFTNATLLEPNNPKAGTGTMAAKVQDPSIYFSDAPEIQVKSVDPFEELKADERNQLASHNKEYQSAKQQLQEGAFREAFPVLKELKTKLDEKIASYSTTSRMPAAVAQDFKNDSRILKEKVLEAMDVANDQFIMEYKSQLDDAKQAASNKRYSEAKAIYDNVIDKEPHFEAPVQERAKLYGVIISQAKNIYQEGLIYESVGDVDNAVDSFEKSKKLLNRISHETAKEYHSKATEKLARLKQ